MADRYSIAEISQLTGLASHTLRYYEQQFPSLLQVERTKGGHRVYRQCHLDNLFRIIKLLKEDRVSIRKAKESLMPAAATEETGGELSGDMSVSELGRFMAMIIERLDSICKKNEKRDQMLYEMMSSRSIDSSDELIEQISRCRLETHETSKLCNLLLTRRSMDS